MASVHTAASTTGSWHGMNLSELISSSCIGNADSVAFIQMGRSITYRELDYLSRNFAAYLQKSLGLRQGERVAIVLPNILQFPIAMLGAIRAGLVVVNTNPMYTASEVERQLKDSGASAAIVLDSALTMIAEVRSRTSVRHVVSTAVGDLLAFPKSYLVNFLIHRSMRSGRVNKGEAISFATSLSIGAKLPLDRVRIASDDLAYLQYTGGTAGEPKGAMLTHGNICANILQCEAWLGDCFSKPDALITALPLYHIFALTISCLLFLRLGWTNHLVLDARDTPRLISMMRKHRFAFFCGVNTLFKALMNCRDFDRVDFLHLQLVLAGGMAVEQDVAEQWKALTGTELTQAWGLTETSPGACVNPRSVAFNGSVGLPIPGTEIAIKDLSGRDVGTGESGEICVRGPQVMAGYWGKPVETAQARFGGGWLRTGDIGHLDERGFLFLEERTADVIQVSGFKVYPSEIESAALSCRGVIEAAAVSRPDPHSGEVVALFIVRSDPRLTESDVLAVCKECLTSYKLPRYIHFVRALPKTHIGKVSRRALRGLAQVTDISRAVDIDSGSTCRRFATTEATS